VFDGRHAYFGVFQRNGVRQLGGIKKAVDADHVARQQRAGDLYLTDGVFELGLDGAGPDAINSGGRIALMEERGTFGYADTFAYNFVEFDDIVAVYAQRQAQAVQHASRTAGRLGRKRYSLLHTHPGNR